MDNLKRQLSDLHVTQKLLGFLHEVCAQAQLPDLIHRLSPGDELIITENDRPVAKLARTGVKQQWPCKAGSARGKIQVAADFDEPLEELREYME
jgi:antitoxin (DNA-binding transcriptional repressor) of toxin-antitoxin stability system